MHHPDDVKRVLVSNHRNYTKGMGLGRVKILLVKGLMTSEGELWKRQRYMMQPFFHRKVITEFARTLEAANERFIAPNTRPPTSRASASDVAAPRA